MDGMIPVYTTQGTRLKTEAPWESYGKQLEVKVDKTLEAEIAEYAKHHHAKTGSQTEDEYYQQKEWNDELSKQYQWLKPEDYANFDARIGRIMSHAEVINRLRKAGIRCWYTEHPHQDKLTLLVGDYWANKKPEVGCWSTYGYAPELSVMRFDDHGVPTNEKYRGWRTVLMQLLLHGFITEEQINKYFPPARQDIEFRKYNMFLYDMRNTLTL